MWSPPAESLPPGDLIPISPFYKGKTGMDDTIKASEALTLERHQHQHRKIKKKHYGSTEEFVAVTGDLLLQPLIKFLRDDPNCPRPPPELEERLRRIPDHCAYVALAILAPLLDAFARGREDGDRVLILNRKGERVHKRDTWRTALTEQLGAGLRDWLVQKEMEEAAPAIAAVRAMETAGLVEAKSIPRIRRGRKPAYKFLYDDWNARELVVAGDWMLRTALAMPCCFLAKDKAGRIYITPEWQDKIDKICEDLLYKHPVMLPHREPPPPWTDWRIKYGDRLSATFITKGCPPETRKAIESRFETAKPPAEPAGPFAELADAKLSMPFPHADGLNALKAVPLRINQSLLPLVDKFAAKLMGHDGKKLTADRKIIKADLRHARWCGNAPIHLDYHCDDRGRVYALQQLNYSRQDHVRALFEFERGEPLSADGVGGKDAMEWLEIHCANSYGEDKKPWADRLRWAKEEENKEMIDRIAADPQASFEHWRKADKPFAFVAACIELSRARKNSVDETHLPIGFDATASGIQHLAMLSRDLKVGKLTNLVHNDRPYDVYAVVIAHIMQMLANEDPRLGKEGCEWFGWWRSRLLELTKKQRRKLLKTPIMTFAYSSTVRGMRDKIIKTYLEMLPARTQPTFEAATFLATVIRRACADKLPGPAGIMKYIQALAWHRFKQGKFLELPGPTGFPFANICYKPQTFDIDLDYGGIRTRYTVADGPAPEIDKSQVRSSAAPNFVHFLDATHLIFIVLEANKEGIRDILCVHDSYSCLATRVPRLGRIIRAQFAALYTAWDPLRALHDANANDCSAPRLPELGNLNPLDVQDAEYPFM